MGLFGFIKKKLLGKKEKTDPKLEDKVIKEQEELIKSPKKDISSNQSQEPVVEQEIQEEEAPIV